MRYDTVRNGLIAFLIAYFVLGIGAFYFSRAHEAYPFFSWALFQKVPQHDEVRTTVWYTKVDGIVLDAPVLARDAAATLGFPQATSYEPLIAFMVSAGTMHDDSELARIRRQFEELLPRVNEYELVTYTYDPIEYWKSEKIGEIEVLRSFTRGI